MLSSDCLFLKQVAVKCIPKSKVDNAADLRRLRHEIEVMSLLQHPHIIKVTEGEFYKPLIKGCQNLLEFLKLVSKFNNRVSKGHTHAPLLLTLLLLAWLYNFVLFFFGGGNLMKQLSADNCHLGQVKFVLSKC